MNKFSKLTAKLVAAAQILAITILAACNASTPSTFCHATGDPANPYQEISVTSSDASSHLDHPNDFYPAPKGGCPTSLLVVNDGKIAICHATGSETNPYNQITVNDKGLNGHGQHAGDIFPAPAGGCPTSKLVTVADKITICHGTGSETDPYNEISVSVNGLNGHATHADDIIPMPAGGCPSIPLVVSNGKITICHATSSATNSYNQITVSVNGLNGHVKHADDIIPAPEGGCPATALKTVAGKITICHATASEKNPYNEITISINGLNGHGKHANDIIPAPAGGCPTTRP